MGSLTASFRKIVNNILYSGYEQLLTHEIKEFNIPGHIAIIMDGNRRFAKRCGMSMHHGHIRGADTTQRILDLSYELGVKQLTIYAFSTENLSRSYNEKKNLFDLIGVKLEEIINDERTHKRRMNVRILGNTDLLPLGLQKIAKQTEYITRNYDNFYLNIALAYGGRQEIVDTARIIATKIHSGKLLLSDINENTISSHLYPSPTLSVPDVDLIIRTGGDERISNFLPWQASGNECAAYFCAPYWPEFRKIDFLRSIRTYQTRERERLKNTVLRIVRLLNQTGHVEVKQVVCMSRKTVDITANEVLVILQDLSRTHEMRNVSFVW
ncbi:MAG: di-trans,poly-cis-decaprenylcistransferase [Methanosarcinales archaeon]|nr:di-trans,poly-cis-decaprenylcistransferase [Methanosarcinales archaeon]